MPDYVNTNMLFSLLVFNAEYKFLNKPFINIDLVYWNGLFLLHQQVISCMHVVIVGKREKELPPPTFPSSITDTGNQT
jgi:hypothetical protein